MVRKHVTWVLTLAFFVSFMCASEVLSALNASPPSSSVKLIFIHHSCGENWLSDSNGGLGIALRNNKYFVSDTYYGWGPDGIGDNTDIGHWWDWFRGPNSATYLQALYTESEQCQWWECFTRLATDPGGENKIIMFKSCYPNSYIGGNPNAAATTGANPLRSQDSSSEYMTVANAKGIYNDLLEYFATRQDKLFIAVTAPAQVNNETDATHAANARALNTWLVNDWLDNYSYNNVAVFDFYNVLTSNGGNVNTNDSGEETGNHHRWWNGEIQHVQTVNSNLSAYGSGPWDSHPRAAGNQKATDEFIDLLNIWYNCWNGTGSCPGEDGPAFNLSGITTDLTAAPAVGSAVQITFTPSVSTGLYFAWWERSGIGTATLGNWGALTASLLNNNTYSWTAAGENRYLVLAQVAETANATTNIHQIGLTFETQGFSTTPIQITSFTTDATFPHPRGTAINLSATATGSGGQVYFRYFYNFGAGWTAAGPWSTSGDLALTLPQTGVVTIVVHASYDTTASGNSNVQAGMTCTIGN